MRVRVQLALLVLLAALIGPARAVTVQSANDVEAGNPYLWVEAENYLTIDDGGGTGTGWIVVDKESPISAVDGSLILPEDSNVSGTAIFDQQGGAQRVPVVYEVQFTKAGTYQLFLRHTMYNVNGDGSYGSEDSIFVSPAFDLNSTSDWLNFEGQACVSDCGIHAGTYADEVSASAFNGWLPTRDGQIMDQGVLTNHNSPAEDFWNGQFHWYTRDSFVKTNAGGGFANDFGFKNQYIVTEADLNKPMTFEVSTRENYVGIDGFLFTTNPRILETEGYTQDELTALILGGNTKATDLNGDKAVDAADAGLMFADWGGPGSTSPADFNKDGFVDAADAGTMFADWTGDPATPGTNAATAEYNSETGELKVSSAGAVNLFVQSAGSHITPLSPAPSVPVGLLTNNASRVGITNLGPINLSNFSFGNIGKGLAQSDLKLVYTPALGQKGIEVAAGSSDAFKYIPEPASFGMLGLGVVGLLAARRRS